MVAMLFISCAEWFRGCRWAWPSFRIEAFFRSPLSFRDCVRTCLKRNCGASVSQTCWIVGSGFLSRDSEDFSHIQPLPASSEFCPAGHTSQKFAFATCVTTVETHLEQVGLRGSDGRCWCRLVIEASRLKSRFSSLSALSCHERSYTPWRFPVK